MDIQNLALEQVETGKAIEKILTNFRKDSEIRKTKKYIEDRMEKLQALWETFRTTHNQLQEISLDHPYSTTNYYGQVEAVYLETTQLLTAKLKTIESKEAATQPIEQKGATSKHEDELRKLNKKYDIQKASILRFIDKIEQAVDQDRSKAYYSQKVKTLTEYWFSLKNLHDEIIANYEEETFNDERFEELEDLCEEILVKLQEKQDTGSAHGNQDNSTNGATQKLKLSPIKLPYFYGNLKQWVSFHDIFVEMIHKNESLKNVQKLQYLKTHLSGEAERLISHLGTTSDNYQAAWKLIESRYNNRRLLVATHVQALLSLQPLTAESAQGIKRLHDIAKENLHALQNLKINTKEWDPIILQILIQKLDKETHRQFEHSLKNPREVPTLEELFSFLETRFQALEAVNDNKSKRAGTVTRSQQGNTPFKTHHASLQQKCKICEGNHKVFMCEKFRNMENKQKYEICKRDKLCTNCLTASHSTSDCHSTQRCKQCQGKHHTLLHQGKQKFFSNPTNKESTENSQKTSNTDIQSHFASNQRGDIKVLLATAQIRVFGPTGQSTVLKALIDQGSEATFITEDVAQRLQLKKTKIEAKIEGIGANINEIAKASVEVSFQSYHSSEYTCTTKAIVLKKLTKYIPSEPITRQKWQHIDHLVLADQNFNKPGPINMILGADVYSEIILNSVIKGAPNSPIAQKTKIGWILSGPVKNAKNNNCNKLTCMISNVDLDNTLKTFWEVENIEESKAFTLEEKQCEEYFKNNHKRKPDGRYVVRIPFNRKIEILEDNKKLATARLLQLERRFQKDPNLAAEYKKFIDEYITLNHMTPVKPSKETQKVHYLPHHAVIKISSSTTKVRAVFDASAKTCSGLSLNEAMMNGPILQEDLSSILLRWRIHRIAYTADIEKMYRQIEVDECHRDYHRILWRDSPNEKIKEYTLNTVTYGTKAAPYLAIKTLHQLAHDEKDKYPEAARILTTDFYVDDLMSGNDNIEEATNIQQQLIRLLQSGKFNLRKWSSNDQRMLKGLPKESIEQKAYDIELDNTIKTLGLHWNPNTDVFEFKIHLSNGDNTYTKRKLLSDCARFYDPLGWFAPVTVMAKLMFQELWKAGIDWDDQLPVNLTKKWSKYRKELPSLENIKIPRWLHYTKTCKVVELHGFSDASETAYAAVIYSRIITEYETVVVTLVAAKTKVAPINRKLSTPKLELCGAYLLTNLMKQTLAALKLKNITVKAWTDSKITLGWIKGDPNRWKTFVANRVSEIQSVIQPEHWSYIGTDDNPADCASRGIYPSDLNNHKLWWKGPRWLSLPNIKYTEELYRTDLEQKRTTVHTITTVLTTTMKQTKSINNLLARYSNITKAKRIIAYCQRYINIKLRSAEIFTGPLRPTELDNALMSLIRAIQREYFSEEIRKLSKGQDISPKSSILKLTPFLDKNNILRLRGRLEEADITYDQKHPIIIPYESNLTSLLIDEAHKATMHGGSTLTLSHLRNKYWIISGLRAVKKIIHKCTICHRYKAKIRTQLMGNLPAPRVTIDRPFTNTGVDYAGPIDIRVSKGRGNKSYKGYIAIFICLATKAVHLEGVSDMTAEAFIAAFKRFTARRGNIKNIYSDNGTNFVKARKILAKDEQCHFQQYDHDITTFLAKQGVQWHFIPACSPHFGGLWEAGVKSIKHHLRRTVGEAKLTFEELSTLLAQIEACLNSRPLCGLSHEPDDLQILTPGHFLIGSSLLSPPERNRLEENVNLLSRWHLLERKRQEFWKKWQRDYLSRLQQRPKWCETKDNIEVGEVVLLKEDNLPPSQWALGRITETHPGQDGLTRVVSIKTAKNTLKRPISKVSPLPISDNEELRNKEKKREEQKNPDTSKPLESERACAPANQDTASAVSSYTTVNKDVIDKFRKIAQSRRPPKRKINPTSIPVRPPLEELLNENKKRREERRTEQERSRSIATGLLSTLLLTCLVLPIQCQELNNQINITQFQNHPGIYFEDLGQAELTNNEWKIIVYYNMDIYWQELIMFRNTIQSLKGVCNKIHNHGKDMCDKIANQFQHKMDEIEFKNKLLHSGTNNQTRRRRGAINIVGNVANSLFGILDSEFAKHHEEQIHQLQQNEDHILTLIKKQTSVAETTKNIIKKETKEIAEQFKTFQDHIAALNNNTEINENRILEQQRTISMANLGLYLLLLMNNYMRTQNALISVVANIHNGKIDPLLLTPDQLHEQLEFIRNHMPSSLRVPADSTSVENTLEIYKLLKVKARVTSHNTIFEVKIPLVAREQYQLFKVIPVPVPHDNKFIFIEPSTDYIIVSIDREQFYPITTNEVQQCTALREDKIICTQHKPLYNLLSNTSKCEMSLLRHERELTSICRVRSMKPSQVWIQLHDPNTWIFVLDQDYTFNIICDNKLITTTLSNDGMIQLGARCSIKQKTMTINSHNYYPSQLNSSFSPHMNISEKLTISNISKKGSSRYINTEYKGTVPASAEHCLKIQKN